MKLVQFDCASSCGATSARKIMFQWNRPSQLKDDLKDLWKNEASRLRGPTKK